MHKLIIISVAGVICRIIIRGVRVDPIRLHILLLTPLDRITLDHTVRVIHGVIVSLIRDRRLEITAMFLVPIVILVLLGIGILPVKILVYEIAMYIHEIIQTGTKLSF